MELHTGWGPLHVCQSGHTVQGAGHVGDVTAGTTAPAVLPCQGGTDVVNLVGTSDDEARRRPILQTSAIREKNFEIHRYIYTKLHRKYSDITSKHSVNQ